MLLVTGGAGFIGSHLVQTLLDRGNPVRVVDNFSTGRRENLAPFADRIDLVEGDLSDPAIATRAVEGVRLVFHQAALPSVPRSIRDPLHTHASNVTATLNLLEAARNAGVRRFVYAASSSAYGDTPTLPKVETMPTNPRSPYAVAKLAGEAYCQAFYRTHGLETVALRYFNIFGPRQDPASEYAAVIPRFFERLMSGEPPVIFGDGFQSRDFTYIENAVQANLCAAEADGVAGEVFNVGCGQRFTLNRLVEMMQHELRTRIPTRHIEPRPGDVRHSQADIEKARERLGYEPKVSLQEGLRRTLVWMQEGRQEAKKAA